MAPTSTYSTEVCVSFFGLYSAARRSRRSSGTLATPMWASRGLLVCAERCALVRIRNRDVLPTWGRPMMPVFIKALSFGLLVFGYVLLWLNARTGLTVGLGERQTTFEDK